MVDVPNGLTTTSWSTMFRLLLLLTCTAVLAAQERKSFIVHLGFQDTSAPLLQEETRAFHKALVSNALGSSGEDSIFYHYSYGFAAQFTAEQAQAVAEHPRVIAVLPNQKRNLHTTESWRFLGLPGSDKDSLFGYHSHWKTKTLWNKGKYGRDIIIGSLDSGVWPEAESFSDAGLGPIPKKWRGICQSGDSFNSTNCNRKLIGARYYVKGYELGNGSNSTSIRAKGDFISPRDSGGHGTHTSSTAAGSFVHGANLYGYANGTASGGAPHARIAAYKVCWPQDATGAECYDADILAAIEDALQDGVDVITMSIGGAPSDYFLDHIAISSYKAAVLQGVPVVCSAGNDGPTPGSVSNVAPWILTVGASSIDRGFLATVTLGNKQSFQGQTVADNNLPNRAYPLISSASASSDPNTVSSAELCLPGSLDPTKVKGKIVACLRGKNARVEKGQTVLGAGGVGMVLCNAPENGNEIVADAHVLPALQITATDGQSVFAYINSTANPTAYISAGTTKLNVKPSPSMAAFSSRGPNTVTPNILKPDITGPGLNILAAYTGAASPTTLSTDHRRVKFNLMSGTSMSCPHVAGVVTLLRAYHPDWSAAAIKSAIVTTGYLDDNRKEMILDADLTQATPFAFGGGHINPNAAADPGLVYDADEKDYVKFLCGLGYNQTILAGFFAETSESQTCSKHPPGASNLNYPSIAISNLNRTSTVTRRVTNVGHDKVYRAIVDAPKGIHVSVTPSVLHFDHVGQTKEFKVRFHAKHSTNGSYSFGYLTWKSHKHAVRSPLAILAN